MYAKAQETLTNSVSYLGYTLSKLPHVLTWKKNFNELCVHWQVRNFPCSFETQFLTILGDSSFLFFNENTMANLSVRTWKGLYSDWFPEWPEYVLVTNPELGVKMDHFVLLSTTGFVCLGFSPTTKQQCTDLRRFTFSSKSIIWPTFAVLIKLLRKFFNACLLLTNAMVWRWSWIKSR